MIGPKVLLNYNFGLVVFSNGFLECPKFLIDLSLGLETLDVQIDLT